MILAAMRSVYDKGENSILSLNEWNKEEKRRLLKEPIYQIALYGLKLNKRAERSFARKKGRLGNG